MNKFKFELLKILIAMPFMALAVWFVGVKWVVGFMCFLTADRITRIEKETQ